MALTDGAIFGDYAALYDLRFNVLFRTSGRYGISTINPESADYDSSAMMCVRAKVFLDLCTLYPKTKERLQVLALEKRAMMHHYLEVVERVKVSRDSGIDPVSGVPRNIESSEAPRRQFPEFFAEPEPTQMQDRYDKYKSEETGADEPQLSSEDEASGRK